MSCNHCTVLTQVRSLVLFVTHYPPLGELESIHPGVVRNYHMAYVEAKDNGMPCTHGYAHMHQGILSLHGKYHKFCAK